MKTIFAILFFVCVGVYAQHNPIPQPFDFAKELSQLEPTPKPIISWTWGDNAWAHGKELARITHSVAVSLRWDSLEKIKQALEFEPEIIVLHWSPYSDSWKAPGESNGRRWNKDDCEQITQRDSQYWVAFFHKAMAASKIIGDKAKVVVAFDHETCWAQGPVISQKLNVFYNLAKHIFGSDAKVFFYDYNQYASGRGLAVMQRASPVSNSVQSDFCSFSLYYAPKSVECLNRVKFTLQENDKPAVAWVTIAEHYADYTYIKLHERSKNFAFPMQYGETWWLGFWLSNSFPARNPDKFGDVKRIEMIGVYPSIGKHEGHLIMFLKGCNGIYVER